MSGHEGSPRRPLAPVPLVRALVLGLAGGALFMWIGTPLPWLIGAIAATALAALAGQDVAVPKRLRDVMLTILGVLLGSGFSPAALGSAGEALGAWAFSLALVVFYALAMTAIGYAILRGLGRYDRATSYFAAAPGGLSEMIVIGGAMGGDDRVIALMHVLRVIMVVTALTIYFGAVEGAGSAPIGPAFSAVPLAELGWLAACTLGWPVAIILKLPAPQLSGPLLASAVLHGAGVVEASPPALLVAAAQLVLGASIGARFLGFGLHEVLRTARMAALITAVLLAASLAAMAVLASLTELRAQAVLLAFAPGGLAETSLIALAIGIEPGYVALHHFTRIGVILAVVPLAFRLVGGARRGPPAGG